MDALHALAREDRDFGADFLRQATMNPAAIAGILPFAVLTNDHPVDLVRALQPAVDPGQQPGRTHIGILIEALADRQAQIPERDMIRHLLTAYRAKVDRIEPDQLIQPPLGNVTSVLQVIVGTPWEIAEFKAQLAALFRQGLQHLLACLDDLDADTVAGDHGDLVLTHAGTPLPLAPIQRWAWKTFMSSALSSKPIPGLSGMATSPSSTGVESAKPPKGAKTRG